MSNKTIDYYNQNADSFVQGTVSVDFKETQDKFLQLLTGKTILDFGCGSGRDTKYFLESGFDVTAIDGSEELCKSASVYTGIHVKHIWLDSMMGLIELAIFRMRQCHGYRKRNLINRGLFEWTNEDETYMSKDDSVSHK